MNLFLRDYEVQFRMTRYSWFFKDKTQEFTFVVQGRSVYEVRQRMLKSIDDMMLELGITEREGKVEIIKITII